MTRLVERFAAAAVAALIAVSAVGGCWGLLSGAIVFPPDWLTGTPFADYTLPALILGAVVGGSAATAALLLLLDHRLGSAAALGAGAIQVGWIAGEVLLVGTEPGIMLNLQVAFFLLGAALAALAGDLRRRTAPAWDRPAGAA